MKKLPDAELELMMIIWDAEGPVTRMEIEERMDEGREVLPSTILSLLSRLEGKRLRRKGEERQNQLLQRPCGKGTLFKRNRTAYFKAYVRRLHIQLRHSPL